MADDDADDPTSCPICFETYTSDPSCKDACLPVQSSKCAHVVCIRCVRDMRDAQSSKNKQRKWVKCPTCQAPTAFNAENPTVCLTMCEFARFAGKMKGVGPNPDASAGAQEKEERLVSDEQEKRKKRRCSFAGPLEKNPKHFKLEDHSAPVKNEKKLCTECHARRSQRHFRETQWPRSSPICRQCEGSRAKKLGPCEDKHNYTSAKQETRCCINCKERKSRRHFSGSQWNGSSPTCRLCKDEAPEGPEKYGQTTRLMLAKAPGADAKFLAEVTPLSELPRGHELPSVLTLDGYSRQEWSTINESNEGAWNLLHLKSVDRKKYLRGFLKNLKEREKAAYGTFLLPDGTDGFFVVPFHQPPPPETTKRKKDRDILLCKYVLGLNLAGSNGGMVQVHSNENTKSPGMEVGSAELGALHDEDHTEVDPREGQLENLIRAQEATNAQLASVPRVPNRRKPKGIKINPNDRKPSAGQDWFGWHKLGD